MDASSGHETAHAQLAALRMENRLLRARLEDLLGQARRNEDIMARHQHFDLQLIGAENLRELLDDVFRVLADVSDLDVVTLFLIDPHGQLRRILAEREIALSDYPQLVFIEESTLLQPALQPLHTPALCAFDASRHAALFPGTGPTPASVALMPLVRQQRLIGCLNLGSRDASRFTPHMATDFIARLSSIIAICVENMLNHERITHLGLTDALTQVSNRRYALQRLPEEIERARRQGYTLAFLYLDIDHFKRINDRYGHPGGDAVLVEVAQRIKCELRLGDLLARFGGEEFVALLINASTQQALMVAERIRQHVLDTPVLYGAGQHIEVSVSLGLAVFDPATAARLPNQRLVEDWLAEADAALYRAKANGRNQVALAEMAEISAVDESGATPPADEMRTD